MPRKHNSGKHGNGRRYIMDAILEALPDGEWTRASDLVDDVSRLVGKKTSQWRIGSHMSYLEDEGSVRRKPSKNHALWKKTWRGGSRLTD